MNAAYGALAVALAAALASWLVLGAIRRTARRQQRDLPPLPACPPARGEPALRAGGVRYLGTTYAPSPVRRFSGYGLLGRGTVELAADPGALRVSAGPAAPWCVPRANLRGAGVTSAHAGKMVSGERVLVVDWQLGGTVLRSGFALADDATARRWASLLQAMVTTATTAQALLGGRGGSELPPHGQDNRSEINATRKIRDIG